MGVDDSYAGRVLRWSTGNSDLGKKTVKIGECNGLAYKDLMLSNNAKSSAGKVEVRLITKA